MIESMDLGNLSALEKIPEFYIKTVLKYLITISKAFSFCHKFDLVHGNFGLTKVLAHTILTDLSAKIS